MDVQNNLFLRTNARVSRVIFEGNKAVGVAYVPARNRSHLGQAQETIVRSPFLCGRNHHSNMILGHGQEMCRSK